MSESGIVERAETSANNAPTHKVRLLLLRSFRMSLVVFLGALVGVGAFYLLRLLG